MQARTLLKFGAGALFAATVAACGGAHDGNANLEPDPQAAPVRAEVDRNTTPTTQPPGGGS